MRRALVSLFLAIAAIDLFIAAYFAYLITWPFKTTVIHGDDKILNTDRTVYPGQALVYKIDYCKYTNVQAGLTRNLVGPVSYPLPASTNNVPPGCRTAISRNTIIPVGVEPGTYHLELSATYRVNPLRAITVRSRSEDFTVTTAPNASAGSVSASSYLDAQQAGLTGTERSAASPAPTVIVEPATSSPEPQPSLFETVMAVLRGLL